MNEEQIAEVMRLVVAYGVMYYQSVQGRASEAELNLSKGDIIAFIRSMKEQPPILSQAVEREVCVKDQHQSWPATEEEAFQLWRSEMPYQGATDKQEQAFRDGFKWATRAALDRPAVREGWVMVPVEPTEEMLDDGHRVKTGVYAWDREDLKSGWRKMLAAAPKEPT